MCIDPCGHDVDGRPNGLRIQPAQRCPVHIGDGKHAVEGLTKAAALEGAASGVRVNTVAPGPVETEMLNRFTGGGERKADFLDTVPVKRAATPEEIADTILFLACKAPFLTGQSIVVDGGKTAA